MQLPCDAVEIGAGHQKIAGLLFLEPLSRGLALFAMPKQRDKLSCSPRACVAKFRLNDEAMARQVDAGRDWTEVDLGKIRLDVFLAHRLQDDFARELLREHEIQRCPDRYVELIEIALQ